MGSHYTRKSALMGLHYTRKSAFMGWHFTRNFAFMGWHFTRNFAFMGSHSKSPDRLSLGLSIVLISNRFEDRFSLVIKSIGLIFKLFTLSLKLFPSLIAFVVLFGFSVEPLRPFSLRLFLCLELFGFSLLLSLPRCKRFFFFFFIFFRFLGFFLPSSPPFLGCLLGSLRIDSFYSLSDFLRVILRMPGVFSLFLTVLPCLFLILIVYTLVIV